MDRWVGKVAVVTGASAGIGAAIAEALVKAGVKVVGAARRVERMETAAKALSSEKGKLYPIKVDLSKEQDILDMFDWIKKNLGGVDILINNAGIILEPTISSLSDGQTNQWRKQFDVNVFGLCIATREAVRSMKARNSDGHIIHISSVGGRKIPHGAGPVINTYAASKFAVQALAETLQTELLADKRKIKVSVVAPGVVSTEILEGSSVAEKMKERLQTMTFLKPEDISQAVLYVLSTPPNVLVKDLIITPIDEV